MRVQLSGANRFARLVLCGAIVISAMLTATRSRAGRRLFVLWEPSTATCAPKVTRFFTCVLARPDFNALVVAYPKGEAMTLEDGAIVNAVCAHDDFQCLVDSAGISPRDGDMVVHYYADAPRVGHNDVAQVTVRGTLVSLRIAWIASDADCDYQLAGGHEVFEGITEPSAADCCDGQQSPTCAQCAPSCASFRSHSSYELACGSEMLAVGCPGVASLTQSAKPIARMK